LKALFNIRTLTYELKLDKSFMRKPSSFWQKINKRELLSKKKAAFKNVRENGEDFDRALRGEEAEEETEEAQMEVCPIQEANARARL